MSAEQVFLNLNIDETRTKIELGFASQYFTDGKKGLALQRCDPDSIRNAVITVARTGITLNPALKLAYLIPRKGKCTLDISYMGLREILLRAGVVLNLEGFIVYEDELADFKIEYGTNAYITHSPKFDFRDPKDFLNRRMVGVYTVAHLNTGHINFEYMPAGEVLAIKAKYSEAGDSEFSGWNIKEVEGEFWKKTCIKRHWKKLPKTNLTQEVIEAIESEHEIDKDTKPLKNKASITDLFDEAEIVEPESELVKKEDPEKMPQPDPGPKPSESEPEFKKEVKAKAKKSQATPNLLNKITFAEKLSECKNEFEKIKLIKEAGITDSEIAVQTKELSKGNKGQEYLSVKALLTLEDDQQYVLSVLLNIIELKNQPTA